MKILKEIALAVIIGILLYPITAPILLMIAWNIGLIGG